MVLTRSAECEKVKSTVHTLKNSTLGEQTSIELIKDLLKMPELIEFTRFVFDYLLDNKENFPDLWKIYIKFADKNYHGKDIYLKICKRASRFLQFDFHLAEEILLNTHKQTASSGDSDALRNAFTELSYHFVQDAVQSLKLAEIYFKLLINQTVRKVVADSPDYFDDLEYLLTTINFFHQSFGEKKDLNFEERQHLASIYKSYLQFIIRLQPDDLEKIPAVDVCEKLVRISGNEEDNWLLYISFLQHVNSLAVKDPIRIIFKRALRFCKGDTKRIYNEYRQFEMLYGDNMEELKEIDKLYHSIIQTAGSTGQPKEAIQRGRQGAKVEIHTSIPEASKTKLASMANIYEKQEKSNLTVYMKGLPLNIDRAGLLDLLPNVN